VKNKIDGKNDLEKAIPIKSIEVSKFLSDWQDTRL